MLDVGGRDELDRSQPGAGGRRHAAECVDHAAATVGTGAAAQPDHDARGARRQRGVDQLADAAAVRVDRGLTRRASAEQSHPAPWAHSTYAVSTPRRTPTARSPRRTTARWSGRASSFADRLASTSTKPGPRRIAGRGRLVARPAAPPPVGDGLGRFDGGQAVAEAVGGDQHAQRLAHSPTVGPWGRRCMSGRAETEVTWQA